MRTNSSGVNYSCYASARRAFNIKLLIVDPFALIVREATNRLRWESDKTTLCYTQKGWIISSFKNDSPSPASFEGAKGTNVPRTILTRGGGLSGGVCYFVEVKHYL